MPLSCYFIPWPISLALLAGFLLVVVTIFVIIPKVRAARQARRFRALRREHGL